MKKVLWHRAGMFTMLIDLRKLCEPLSDDIRNSLITFSTRYPYARVCTVGLWGDGFHGTASLHLDTSEHSSASVEKWQKNGPNWYGEDDKGRFCNNCWDFEHCTGEYSFPDYPDLYQVEHDTPVEYVALNGTHAVADEGDDGKNRLVFPFLKAVLASFQPFSGLLKDTPFRAGVQMRDSRCEDFWLVELDGG